MCTYTHNSPEMFNEIHLQLPFIQISVIPPAELQPPLLLRSIRATIKKVDRTH